MDQLILAWLKNLGDVIHKKGSDEFIFENNTLHLCQKYVFKKSILV